MKKKTMKRLMSWVLAAAMVVAMLPVSVLGAPVEGSVAKIGDTEYATLDEAVEKAEEGATIELLGDATTSGMNLSKNLTIQAAEGLSVEPTITFTQYGIALRGKSLTFKDCKVVMNGIGSTPYTAEWSWMTICASVNASLTLDNVDMTMDATGTTNSPHAIYFCKNNVLNIINESNLTIKNYANDALEWDGGNGGYNVNITDSTYISDHNRSGFTGTFNATFTNSTVKVINSTGNGSNGSNFYIENSTVDFSNNGSNGLSAGSLTIEQNSHVTADSNGMYGVYVKGDFLVDSTSALTVTKNSSKGDCAGLKLTSGVKDGKVESGAVVNIIGNYCSGLSNNGKVVFEEGSHLTITGNHNDKGTTSNGGGVYNSGASANLTLPSDAVIYNNHAKTAGDDIFSNTESTITFGQVGSDWALDGDEGDCTHFIDGWYGDSANARWEAHADTDEGNHIEEFTEFGENGLAIVNGLTALKAAHGLDTKISLPGLDKDILVTGEDGSETGADSDTVAAGDTVKFELESNVPQNLEEYIDYPETEDPEISPNSLGTAGKYTLVFHDEMATELTLDEESIQVMLDDEEIAGQYVNINYDPDDNCTFEVSVDLAAMYNNDVITEQDLGVTPITVTYTATLSEDVVAGAYTNTAWVVYPDGSSQPDTVTVYTYGIDIFKYDQGKGLDAADAGLDGAEFALYGADSVTVAEDGTVTVNEGATALRTVTSKDGGKATIGGLDEGTYYLVETKAPDGYVKSDTPLKIVIPEDADGTTYMVNVNFANSQIPHTGGTGTLMFTIGGAAIIATAGVLLLVSRKKKKA